LNRQGGEGKGILRQGPRASQPCRRFIDEKGKSAMATSTKKKKKKKMAK